MAHYKRKGPKSTRSGCLFCKPHKHQRAKDKSGSQPIQELRSRISEKEQGVCRR